MPSAPASIASFGRAHRIGMPPAARVADGGDVIDVDAEAKLRNPRHVLFLVVDAATSPGDPLRRRHHLLGAQLRDDRR